MKDGLAFDDAGEHVPYVDFDWDALEKAFKQDLKLFKAELKAGEYSQEDLERAGKAMKAMLKWAWQGGMKNEEGMKIRFAILCWGILPELRPLSLTQLAGAFGKPKQSFGRWVDNLKEYFPWFRSPHMRWK